MREDANTAADAGLLDLGAASEITQGSFLLRETEAVVIKDHWDEP